MEEVKIPDGVDVELMIKLFNKCSKEGFIFSFWNCDFIVNDSGEPTNIYWKTMPYFLRCFSIFIFTTILSGVEDGHSSFKNYFDKVIILHVNITCDIDEIHETLMADAERHKNTKLLDKIQRLKMIQYQINEYIAKCLSIIIENSHYLEKFITRDFGDIEVGKFREIEEFKPLKDFEELKEFEKLK